MSKEHHCEVKEPEKMYKIGMFSKMNHVTIKALRHYDDCNLLKPAYVDEWSGYRYYTSAQLPLLHEIIALRKMEFSIEEIKQIQNGSSEKSLLLRKKQQLLAEIAEKTARLAQVESYLSSENSMNSGHIIIKELPEIIVASMRKVIPDYDSLFDIIPPMGAEMERLGCVCAEPDYCFVTYHDGEYKEEDIDVEFCQEVTEMKQDSDMVSFKRLPRIPYAACILHKGPYNKFPDSYAKVVHYAEENGYEIIDNPRESYIDGVWNKDSEEEWLSEIQFPVRKMNGK